MFYVCIIMSYILLKHPLRRHVQGVTFPLEATVTQTENVVLGGGGEENNDSGGESWFLG